MNSYMHVYTMWSQYSSVGVAMDYELGEYDSIPYRRKRFFSTPQCPDQIWGPFSL
jgi:hypothetical protein